MLVRPNNLLSLRGGNLLSTPFNPMSLSPTIYYDIGDLDLHTLVLNDISQDYLATTAIVNKANAGTYNASKAGGTNLMVDAGKMKGHFSLGNVGNTYFTTGYKPNVGNPFTVSMNIVLPSALTNASFFGANDGGGKRLFGRLNAAGTLLLGVGSQSLTTASTYVVGQTVNLHMEGTGTAFTAWINGVKVFDNVAYTSPGQSNDFMMLHARTNAGAPTEYFNNGFINSFVYLERVLTTTERDNLMAFQTGVSSDNLKIETIPACGQSNMVGKASGAANYATTEKPDPRIFQLVNGLSGTLDKRIIPAWEPLKYKDRTSGAVGMAWHAAKAYLATVTDPDVRILIVPTAVGDTGYTGTGEWVATVGSLYIDTVDRTNLALASFTNNELLWMTWQQGEHEVTAGTNQAAYAAFYDTMAAAFRADITGASNLIVTCGDMVSNYQGNGVSDAIKDVNNRDPLSLYVSSTGTTALGDNVHFTAPSSRAMGEDHALAYLSA